MAIARAKAIPAAAPKAQRTLAPKARKPAMLPKSDGHAGVKAYIKFSFFNGASLQPMPPVSGHHEVRSLDVREPDKLNEQQLADWFKQAAATPGWDGGSKRNGGRPG